MAEGRGLATVVNAGQTRLPALGRPRARHRSGPEARIKAGDSAAGATLVGGGGWEEHDFRFQYFGSRSGCSRRRPAVTLHTAGLSAVLSEGELPG